MRSEENTPKMRDQQLVCPLRLCSSTPVRFGQGFLSKEQRETIGASPHSTDLTSSDFCQFSQLKPALKGCRSCDVNNVIKNATEEPKMFSKNGFHECSHHRYSRWQKFIVTLSDYFESSVA
jgi:hypothetical protein